MKITSIVGFGGSIIWFGSSSGVALSSMYPEKISSAMAASRLAHYRRISRRLLLDAGRLGLVSIYAAQACGPFPNVTSAAMKDWFFLRTSRGEPQLAEAAHGNPQ
jgi:hypothetical protein